MKYKKNNKPDFEWAWKRGLIYAKALLTDSYLTVSGIPKKKTNKERGLEDYRFRELTEFIHWGFQYGPTPHAVWMELMEEAKKG